MFDLTYNNRTSERIGYFVTADGVNTNDKACTMVVEYDPHASGCNSYYWSPQRGNYFGHEFSDPDEARQQAEFARGSYNVKSVDKCTIKVSAVKFKCVNTATYLGVQA